MSTALTTHPMTEKNLVDMIRRRYSLPEWATFDQVRNATGAMHDRTIDVFAINCYPSSRIRYIACEVKVDRADFRRELDQPEKREAFAKLVNEFWYVAPRGVIPAAEVPDGCGLLETWGQDKLRATIRARQNLDNHPDEFLWISLARRMSETMQDARHRSKVFAEWRGKSISIDDLRRLASKLGMDRDVQIRAEMIAHEMRRAAKKTAKQWIAQNHFVLRDVQRAVKADLGKGYYEAVEAGEIAEWLRRKTMSDKLAGLASDLRRCADWIDQVTERDRS